MRYFSEIKINILFVISLGVVTYVLHNSALSGFYRFDDGVHLLYVALYSPWEYFFNPEITGLQSNYIFVTPWNALTYEINLWLFGLVPKGYYLSQLIMLWCTGIATYLLLRLKCSSTWALYGATLFLVGSASVHVAQELMTGHYVVGLFFSILAVYYYIRAVELYNLWFLLFSLVLYILATSCKEVYVPVIGILIFIPITNIKRRLLFFYPFIVIALLYMFWRYNILGGHLIGGYNPGNKINFEVDVFLEIVGRFFYIPLVILGDNIYSEFTFILFIILSIFFLVKNTEYLMPIIVGIFLIFLPLIPVWEHLGVAGRYLFFPWWAFSIYSAILFSNCNEKYNKYQYIIGGAMLILTLLSSYNTLSSSISKGVYKCHDIVSQFILNSNSKQVFFDTDNSWYSSSALAVDLIESEKLIDASSPIRAKIVSDITQFRDLNFEELDVFTYDESCQCMKRINNQIPGLINKAKSRQKNKPLFFNLRYEKQHISWDMGPYKKGSYKLLINIRNSDSEVKNDNYFILSMPKQGSIGFSLRKELSLYVLYYSPDGWFIKSKRLSFIPLNNPELTWSNNLEK